MSATYPDGILLRSNDETFLVVAGERQLISDPALLAEINETPRDAELSPVPVLDVESPELATIPRGPDFEARGVIESSRQDEVRSDMPRRYMSSTVRLSQEGGRLDGDTRTWTRQPWVGYTGGVLVLLIGPNEEILHNTAVVQFGVDGFRIPFKRSDRTDHWVHGVPVEASRATARLEIVHTHAPKNRVLDIIREAQEVGKALSELLVTLRMLGG
jgi:hypothetical protein